jgi:hypothetical protein
MTRMSPLRIIVVVVLGLALCEVGCRGREALAPMQPAETRLQELLREAADGLWTCYPEVDPDQWRLAEVGQAIPVLVPGRVRTPDDLYSHAQNSGLCYVPVQIGDQVVGMFTAQWSDGHWDIADIGGDVPTRVMDAVGDIRAVIGERARDFQVFNHKTHGLLVAARTDENLAGCFLYPQDMSSLPSWLRAPEPAVGRVYTDDDLMRFLR